MPSASGAFALGTFAFAGESFVGLARGEQVRDLSTLAADLGMANGPLTTRALLADWERVQPLLADIASRADGSVRALAELDVRPPVAPRQVFQAGANYRSHVIELAVAHRRPGDPRSTAQIRDETAAMMDRRAADGIPYLFVGLPSAIAGPFDEVVLPAYSDQHDWELELAAVIGPPAFRVGRDEALRHVAAYTIANDLTTRDLVFRRDVPEIGTDWFRAKNAPGFLPLGPYLVPSAFVDPGDLRVRLTLNGRLMQDESTKDMIFDVAALVSAASQITRLLPGDLVLTGSPAGNGAHWGRLLQPGDVLTGSITALGEQRTRFVADPMAASGQAEPQACEQERP